MPTLQTGSPVDSRRADDRLGRGSWHFRLAEPSGPYAVGLRVVENCDYSRSYPKFSSCLKKDGGGPRARPLQTLIWYPAEPTTAAPVRVRDYARLLATEMTFGRPRTSKLTSDWLRGITASLDDQLLAVLEAPKATGRFPVVVYAPGFSNPSWDNADLCEHLATYGYVVIATGSCGVSTRRMTYDLPGIEAQARDISFLAGYAAELPNTDASKVCAVGFSWGGIANVFAAARDERIRALVTLDGSHRFSPGFIRRTPDVDPSQMSVPLLSIAQGRWSPETHANEISEDERSGPDVVGTWRGDTVSVLLFGMAHGDFSAMFQRNEELQRAILEPWHQQHGDASRETAVEGYACMARYCRHFLDAYCKGVAEECSFIQARPDCREVASADLRVTHRSALGPPSSRESFRDCVIGNGYQNIYTLYTEFSKNATEFQLTEDGLEEWCDELLNESCCEEAVRVARFIRQIYPRSSRAHLILGYVYESLGERHLACMSYEHALEQDPTSIEAAAKRRELSP